MKKEYIKPESDSMQVRTQAMLAESGGATGGGDGSDIDYGGVDEGGDIEPCRLWN